MAKMWGRVGCKLVFGDGIKIDQGEGGRYYRESSTLQTPGAGAGAVRQ